MNNNPKYSKSELENAKKPNKLLNVNPQIKLSNKEKLKILVDSKGFTVIASILTLGGYYMYYLFCLKQTKESPFNKPENKIYKIEGERLKDDQAIEIKNLNKNMCQIISDKPKKIDVKKEGKRAFFKLTSYFEFIASWIIDLLEKLILKITKKEIKINLIEKYRQTKVREFSKKEEKMRAFINKELQKRSQIRNEEYLMDKSLNEYFSDSKKKIHDYYLSFVFFSTYILISIVTLGIFPIYHLMIKERWEDLKQINNHKEHANAYEFDEIIERLINSKGNLEYSVLLLDRKNLSLSVNKASDVFRTKIFKNTNFRKRLITFLMISTLGLFGVFVLSKNVFDQERIIIKDSDTTTTNYETITDKREKIKLFMKDILRDLNTAIKLASQRSSTVNNSLKKVINPQDRYIDKFIKIISSELYFWLFSFIFILGSISLISIIISNFPMYYLQINFWLFIGIIFLFLILFTKHINLLFL